MGLGIWFLKYDVHIYRFSLNLTVIKSYWLMTECILGGVGGAHNNFLSVCADSTVDPRSKWGQPPKLPPIGLALH